MSKVETELNNLKGKSHFMGLNVRFLMVKSRISCHLISHTAELEKEVNAWKMEQKALKEKLAARSPVCNYLKQSPPDRCDDI